MIHVWIVGKSLVWKNTPIIKLNWKKTTKLGILFSMTWNKNLILWPDKKPTDGLEMVFRKRMIERLRLIHLIGNLV